MKTSKGPLSADSAFQSGLVWFEYLWAEFGEC